VRRNSCILGMCQPFSKGVLNLLGTSDEKKRILLLFREREPSKPVTNSEAKMQSLRRTRTEQLKWASKRKKFMINEVGKGMRWEYPVVCAEAPSLQGQSTFSDCLDRQFS